MNEVTGDHDMKYFFQIGKLSNWPISYSLDREWLNVGTVPTFKKHNVGTVPTFKMHNIGTVPTFKMHNVGTVPTYKMHNVGTPKLYDFF